MSVRAFYASPWLSKPQFLAISDTSARDLSPRSVPVSRAATVLGLDKSTDIGVAMGITGTDVTKEAADMILADDNFATIVAAIRERRGIFSNIRKFLRFLLSSNIGEVLTMLLGVVLAGPLGLEDTGEAIAVPLLATQILWINLLTDSAPALAMGVDPPPDDVMSVSRKLSDRVIDAEMWLGIFCVGLVMAIVTLVALDLRLPGGLIGRLDHQRGAHDGLYHARARSTVQLLQCPLGSYERLPPPVHESVVVRSDRGVRPVPGRGRTPPERAKRPSSLGATAGLEHVESRRRRLDAKLGWPQEIWRLTGGSIARTYQRATCGNSVSVLSRSRVSTRARPGPVGTPARVHLQG